MCLNCLCLVKDRFMTTCLGACERAVPFVVRLSCLSVFVIASCYHFFIRFCR